VDLFDAVLHGLLGALEHARLAVHRPPQHVVHADGITEPDAQAPEHGVRFLHVLADGPG